MYAVFMFYACRASVAKWRLGAKQQLIFGRDIKISTRTITAGYGHPLHLLHHQNQLRHRDSQQWEKRKRFI